MDSDRLNVMLPLFQDLLSNVFVAAYCELLSYVVHDASWLLGQLQVQVLAIDLQRDIVKNATRNEDVVKASFLGEAVPRLEPLETLLQ